MLTGRAAFAGDTITDIIAAVVTREPDWTALPAATPASIRRLLTRCLEKDPKRRLRDIGDARLEIEEAIARGSSAGRPGESVAASGASRRDARTETRLDAGRGRAGGDRARRPGRRPGSGRARAPSETRPLRVSIVHTEGSEVAAPAISPDGRRVAYRARRGDGMPLLWVRDLASGESQPLPGTEDATMPFWSPDSRDLGFFAGVALKRVSAAGGPVRVVTDNVGPLDWLRRHVGGRRDHRVQRGKPGCSACRQTAAPRQPSRNCRARIGRTSGRAFCRTAAGSCSPRSCGPAPRKPANRASTSGRWTARRSSDSCPISRVRCTRRLAISSSPVRGRSRRRHSTWPRDA